MKYLKLLGKESKLEIVVKFSILPIFHEIVHGKREMKSEILNFRNLHRQFQPSLFTRRSQWVIAVINRTYTNYKVAALL